MSKGSVYSKIKLYLSSFSDKISSFLKKSETVVLSKQFLFGKFGDQF